MKKIMYHEEAISILAKRKVEEMDRSIQNFLYSLADEPP